MDEFIGLVDELNLTNDNAPNYEELFMETDTDESDDVSVMDEFLGSGSYKSDDKTQIQHNIYKINGLFLAYFSSESKESDDGFKEKTKGIKG